MEIAASALCREQIHAAGQRYSPGLDPSAPNLRIQSLQSAIEAVACGAAAEARFVAHIAELSQHWSRASHFSQQAGAVQRQIEDARSAISPLLARMRLREQHAADDWIRRQNELESALLADVAFWRAKEDDPAPPTSRTARSDGSRSPREALNALSKCLSVIRAEREYTSSASFKALGEPLLLIGGEWGTGKTHLVCDITQQCIDRGALTLLILAKNFEGDVLDSLCRRFGVTEGVCALFDQLQSAALAQGERVLVIVDGVNEGRRQDWRRTISELRKHVASRSQLGLVVTCRTPLENVAIAPNDLSAMHAVTHFGFDDQEFDAQAAFFDYFKLPLPEVPLLDREFSRPLTLKLICQSLQRLSGKKLKKGFAGISSGQKGMTFILESFIKGVSEQVEQKHGLPPAACWELLKGSGSIRDARLSGFASCLIAKHRTYLLHTEFDRIIAAHLPALRPRERRHLAESMRTSGLLDEDVIWYRSAKGHRHRTVLRLPYQRFSDHLIARHLLKTHLDVTSEDTIRQSFSSATPLGRIFAVRNRHQPSFTEPGWAQAVLTEFPERVASSLPRARRELLFLLPRTSQVAMAYFEPFVDGLFWRHPTAFSDGTSKAVDLYLTAGGPYWERTVDALAAVSTKQSHPYHARRLYAYLATFPMEKRDQAWTNFLRRGYASPSIRRLLTWAEHLCTAQMAEGPARELITLLSLVLTTVVRSDRDLATKALVVIGETHPALLFEHALTCLEFNDPYVPERMLASAYGVTMSLVDASSPEAFRELLGEFACALCSRMFGAGAKFATHHALTRDYALGIIQLAIRSRSYSPTAEESADLLPPYRNITSRFVSDGTPDAEVTKQVGSAIRMDFGNYTIGSLIPNRRNYDHEHPHYVAVRAKIERRIFDLGYRASFFDDADADSDNRSVHLGDVGKIDRFGKKYSWIAYFEMWGERAANGALPDWRDPHRPPDCDIDPSFPLCPPQWNAPIPELFGENGESTKEWVIGGFTPNWKSLLIVPEINGHHGNWILLGGCVRGILSRQDRELFAFLRGVLVPPSDVRRLQRRFLADENPGNDLIPTDPSEHYLFAGEAGRRSNYARFLRRKDGVYRRHIVEAFERQYQIRTTSSTDTVQGRAKSNGGKQQSAREWTWDSPRLRRVPGSRVELPLIRFAWESHHSTQNTFSGFDLPAPSLIERLGLANRNREIDFYDREGREATLYRTDGKPWGEEGHSLFYMREDLLRLYLRRTRQTLVWCIWGERDWAKKPEDHFPIADKARVAVYRSHAHIHRSFLTWSP